MRLGPRLAVQRHRDDPLTPALNFERKDRALLAPPIELHNRLVGLVLEASSVPHRDFGLPPTDYTRPLPPGKDGRARRAGHRLGSARSSRG